MQIEYYDIEKEKTKKFFKKGKHSRNQILLGHTSRNLEDYLKGIELRHNGKYTSVPHYIISKKGDIINLVKPNLITNLFGYESIDKENISIFLENEGWVHHRYNKIKLYDWLGNIYKNEVIEKKWRNKLFWAPYTTKQMESLSELIKTTCEEFKIVKEFVGHNVRVSGVEKFKGIVCRSNYSEYFTDLSPAFNFKKLQETI